MKAKRLADRTVKRVNGCRKTKHVGLSGVTERHKCTDNGICRSFDPYR